MLDIYLFDGQETKVLERDSLAEAIRDKATPEQVIWVDARSPEEQEWHRLIECFDFHPLAVEDSREQTERAKLDVYRTEEGETEYLFFSLRAWEGSKGPTDDLEDITGEIDIFLGKGFIVTIHEQDSAPLQQVLERWRRYPHRHRRLPCSPAYILYLILDTVVDDCFPVMDALDGEIDNLETAIYLGEREFRTEDLRPSLLIKKKLLLLRQTVAPLRDLMNQLLRTDEPTLLPESLEPYFQDVYDHTLRLVESVDLHREILAGALETMSAQTGNRLNQVMKKMTGISTILMTAALIAGIYGMNFAYMPELKSPYGYYGALLAMAFISGALAILFKRIGWF